MFANKPSAKTKAKQSGGQIRGQNTKKLSSDGGIFNMEKNQRIRNRDSSTLSSRTESRHEKVPDRVFSAGDNGSSMLEKFKENKVGLIDALLVIVVVSVILFSFIFTHLLDGDKQRSNGMRSANGYD